MNTFRLVHLRRFFQHKARTGLSLSGIAIGAALVVAVLGLFGTLNGSVEGFIRDLTGTADLEVSAAADEGLPTSLYFEIAKAKGVDAAVPMIRTVVLIGNQKALLIGLDRRAQELDTRFSNREVDDLEERATRPGIFVGEALASLLKIAEGETVAIFANGKESSHEVLGVLKGDVASFNQGKFIATALPLAQSIVDRPGRLDSILVKVDRELGIDQVAVDLSSITSGVATVERPAARAKQARYATRDLQAGMLMGTVMALVVGAFLIFNTMNMAATERRKELATLRALGGRRRKLLGMFLLESALIGLSGSVVGAFVGMFLARRLVETIPPFFVSALGVELGFVMPAYSLPIALVAGTATAVAAAFIPARKAVSVSPVESMRPEGVLESADGIDRIARVPALIGGAMVAIGTTLSLTGPAELGFVWVAVMVAGFLIGSYGLTLPITRLTATVANPFGVSGRLAASAVSRAPRRAWATSAAVVVATCMVVAQNGIFANVTDSVNQVVSSLSKIDMYVSASDGASFADVRLPGDWQQGLEQISGISHVGINYFTFINFDGQKVLLQGIEGSLGEAPALASANEAQMLEIESGKGAIVSQRFSELYGVFPGDELTMATPVGPKSFNVVASVPQFTWERGHITIGRSAVIEFFRDSTVSDYMLTFKDGTDPQRVMRDIENFVSDSPIAVHLISGQEQVDIIHGSVDQVNSLFRLMSWVVVAAATLAIFNALLISVLERKRELGIMRAIGTSKRQLRRMVAVEAAALGAVGGGIGLLMGFVLHRASMGAIIATSGFPLEYQFRVSPGAGAFVVGVAISILGSLIPAQRASSVNIIEAIGYE